ncbi:hypothetical protein [Capillimicrobium parvum]|uniref:hypothetical protein n=1 Tax=Capillimicrobium parvum TaxID=2884022 RepID=UPI00216AB60E|nr:hypothetical protein [Capillimicrobium parvum]
MPRIVLTWDRPQHLAREEADRWLREELQGLLAIPEILRIELVRLGSPPACHPQPFAWLCELHLAEGADVGACLARTACAEWLRDLRLLGMRPAVGVAIDPVVLP